MEYYVNKEVFVVAEDEMNTVEIGIYEDIVDVIDHLQTLDPLNNVNTKVYHGFLTKADVLPSSSKGKKCFILVIDLTTGFADAPIEGCAFESDCENDVSILAGEIEHIVNDNEYVTFPIEIENLFVLYGYSIDVTLGINDDEVDDEIIDTCKKVVEETKQIRKDIDPGDQL